MVNTNIFLTDFSEHLDNFLNIVATNDNEWIVKGFIDIYQKIYPMTSDTKVISKIIELMIFPEIMNFAKNKGYKVVLAQHQNHYPDLTFINEKTNELYAVDIKSSYRRDEHTINGMTLGAFTGYFRQRTSTKNITFPYNEYTSHYVLGVIYTRIEESSEAFHLENSSYDLEELPRIESVARDFKFFLQEKWRIASDKPGSGNTKNIGSVKKIERILEGKGLFQSLGKQVFDDYWMNFLTNDMAKAIDSEVPYANLTDYLKWRENLDLKNVDISEIQRIQEEEENLEQANH